MARNGVRYFTAVSLIWFQAAIGSSALAFVTETVARTVKVSAIRMILFMLVPLVFSGRIFLEGVRPLRKSTADSIFRRYSDHEMFISG
jgi:hypothetical protein